MWVTVDGMEMESIKAMSWQIPDGIRRSSKNDDFGKWSIQKLYRAAIHKHTSIYNDHRSRCFQRLHGIDIGNMECALVFGLYIISLQCQPEYRLIHFRRGGRTDSRFPLPGIGSDRRNNIARRRDLYRGGGFLRLFGRDSGEPRKLTDKYRQQSLLRLWTIHSLYSHESDEHRSRGFRGLCPVEVGYMGCPKLFRFCDLVP